MSRTSFSEAMRRLSSEATKVSKARFSCPCLSQPAKTYFFSVVTVVLATVFFANAVEAQDAGTTEENPFVQRKDLSKQLSGLTVG